MRRLNQGAPRRSRRNPATRRLYRALCWAAIPAAVATLIAGVALFGSPARVARIDRPVEAWLLDRTAALGLRVANIHVEGGLTTDRATMLAALGADRGTPILAVDPERAEKRLEALPWVASAVIERRFPDTLYVHLVERTPLALWQHAGRLQLIDATGAVIPVARLDRFAKLPLVVGADAATHAAELLPMLAKEPDLAARVSAAVRVGGRRWNLRIDGRIDVLLPAEDAAGAWASLARLERSSAVLDREVEAIDLRLPDRLVVRVTPQAPKEALPAPGKPRPGAKST